MAFFRDWRSPGEKWIRTDFGWRRLAEIRNSLSQQLRRQFSPNSSSSSKASSGSNSLKVSRAASPVHESLNKPIALSIQSRLSTPYCSSGGNEKIDKQLKQLNLYLENRCVSARSSSRESSHYSTINDAITKLNFEQALSDTNIFPFICQVVALIFKSSKGTLSGSMQNTLLRIMDKAKDICIASKKYSSLVFIMIENAVSSFEKLRQEQFTGFGVRNVDAKIKSVLKIKRQLQNNMNKDPSSSVHLKLSDLPFECLQHIAQFLTNPKDLLNFGATNMKLLQVTEDYHVWRNLTQFHYGCIRTNTVHMDWKDAFIKQYREQEGRLKHETSSAVCWCGVCNFVFWKSYGHPCLTVTEETEITGPSQEYLTPEQFLQLFAF